MLYNYTVVLQFKQHRPRRYKTTAHSLSEVIQKLMKLTKNYTIKSIVRRPK